MAKKFKLAEAFVELFAKTSKFRAALGVAKKSFQATARGLDVAASRIRSNIFGARGIFGALGGGLIIKFAADFEQSMARVAALTQTVGADFERLSGQALELGRTTQFSANQAAQAMGFFAQAGFSVNEIIASMPATLNLAAAGQLDMGTAADIAAKIMKGMGREAEDLGEIVDVLAKAFITSNTDLVQLGEAFKFVGPVGKAAGKSIEELTAAIQLMSNAGVQGGQAGTALRNILLRLQTQPAEVKKAFDKMGVSIGTAAGKMRPLADIIDDLNVAMSDMTDIQRNATAAQIAGLRAAAAFTIILDQGGDELRKFEARLKDAGGTAERVAKRQMETFKGKLLLLKSAAEGAAIALGTEFFPVLTKLAGKLTEASAAIAKLTKFQLLMTVETVKWTAGLAGLVVGLSALANFTKAVLGLALFSPVAIGLIIAAILALAVAFFKLRSNIKELAKQEEINDLIKQVKELKKVAEDTSEAMQKITGGLFTKPSAKARLQAEIDTAKAREAAASKEAALAQKRFDVADKELRNKLLDIKRSRQAFGKELEPAEVRNILEPTKLGKKLFAQAKDAEKALVAALEKKVNVSIDVRDFERQLADIEFGKVLEKGIGDLLGEGAAKFLRKAREAAQKEQRLTGLGRALKNAQAVGKAITNEQSKSASLIGQLIGSAFLQTAGDIGQIRKALKADPKAKFFSRKEQLANANTLIGALRAKAKGALGVDPVKAGLAALNLRQPGGLLAAAAKAVLPGIAPVLAQVAKAKAPEETARERRAKGNERRQAAREAKQASRLAAINKRRAQLGRAPVEGVGAEGVGGMAAFKGVQQFVRDIQLSALNKKPLDEQKATNDKLQKIIDNGLEVTIKNVKDLFGIL